jgi:hypothetical protein
MNLTDELEKSFVDEPAHRPVEQRIAAGRRLVRRRRAATGAAVAAVVIVAGSAFGLLGQGDEATDPGRPAASGPSESGPPETPEPPWAYWKDDGVALRDGVTEIRRLDRAGPAVALELQLGDEVQWYLVDPAGSSSVPAYGGYERLEDFVAEQDQLKTGRPAKPYVEFADDGTLQPAAEGVTIVEQRANPRLPDSYDAGVETAVAEIQVNGKTWYVLARDPSNPDYIPVPASVGGATLDAFLEHSRAQYAGGEGLR